MSLLASGQPPPNVVPSSPVTQEVSSISRSVGPDTNLPTVEVAQAVVVTVELDFGGNPPSIAEALRQIERRHQPDDGIGRTFAILDAYGEPTADGKLHLSMHVSAEKPGVATLIFRRTDEVLWKTRVVAATHPPASSFAGRNLMIMVNDGLGKPYLLDGSKGAVSIMDAVVRDLGVPVRDFWPDGEEREVTFFYSACGCPVKVKARREGDKTVRMSALPVLFPDDPAVVGTISRLMGWPLGQTIRPFSSDSRTGPVITSRGSYRRTDAAPLSFLLCVVRVLTRHHVRGGDGIVAES
jgi:hypothetical protein